MLVDKHKAPLNDKVFGMVGSFYANGRKADRALEGGVSRQDTESPELGKRVDRLYVFAKERFAVRRTNKHLHTLGLLALFVASDHVIDAARHVEVLLWNVIVGSFQNALKATNGFLTWNKLSRRTGELFRDKEVLR